MLRADHAQLVAEIVSPTSQTTEEADKLGEYAKAGTHYRVVRLDATGAPVTIDWIELASERPARVLAPGHRNRLRAS